MSIFRPPPPAQLGGAAPWLPRKGVVGKLPWRIYVVTCPSAEAAPTAAQIVLGQNAAGSPAVSSANIAAPADGTYDWPYALGTLTPGASYKDHFVAWNGSLYSPVSSSPTWLALVLPVLSAATSVPGSITATGFTPRVTITF